MTTLEKVKQARSVQVALLLLAEAIDTLVAQQRDREAEWDEALTWDATPVRDPHDFTPLPDVRARVEGGEVVLPPASPERQAERERWARSVNLASFEPLMLPDDFYDAFAKGGPRWLYYQEGGRKLIMQMPEWTRRALVQDVAQDSTAEAQEIGADILKHDESMPQDAQIESKRAVRDAS